MTIDCVVGPARTGDHGHRTRPCRHLSAIAAATVVVAAFLVLVVPAPAAHADVTFDQQLLILMNQDRAAYGLAPLQSSAPIAAIAENGNYGGCGYAVAGRAADMGARSYFSHTILNCGGNDVFDMLTGAGVPWTSAAENIGWESGSVDPVAAAKILNDQFMNSPGHRANILDANATHVGVGSWRTAAGQTWSGGGAAYANVYVTAVVFAHLPGSVAQPPSAVGGVVAATGTGRVSASWQPAQANGASIDMYGLWAFTTNGAFSGRSVTACGWCTTATIDGLANGTSYLIVVMAHNAAGWGGAGYSGWATPGAPWAPAWVAVNPGPARVQPTWAAANAGSSPVDTYVAVVYEGSTYTNLYAATCGSCTSATIAGLTRGHTYTVYVLAHNVYGWGPAVASTATVS